jgi:hypothetical protein
MIGSSTRRRWDSRESGLVSGGGEEVCAFLRRELVEQRADPVP